METFKIKYSNKQGTSEVEFNGQLTINNIDKIAESLKGNLNLGKSLNVVVKDVEGIDLTFIQIIYSLIKRGENEGIEVKTSIEIPNELHQLIINAGFSSLIK